VNPGVPLELFGTQYPGGKIFNKAAFAAPPTGQQGDFGRNVLRGFGATQVDLALQRQFHLWLANCYFASCRACNITFCRRVSADRAGGR